MGYREAASTIFYAISGRSGVPEAVREHFPAAMDGGCFGPAGAFAARAPAIGDLEARRSDSWGYIHLHCGLCVLRPFWWSLIGWPRDLNVALYR